MGLLVWSGIASADTLEIGPMNLKFPALPQLAALKQALAQPENFKFINGP
jgi:hypothetical protein